MQFRNFREIKFPVKHKAVYDKGVGEDEFERFGCQCVVAYCVADECRVSDGEWTVEGSVILPMVSSKSGITPACEIPGFVGIIFQAQDLSDFLRDHGIYPDELFPEILIPEGEAGF